MRYEPAPEQNKTLAVCASLFGGVIFAAGWWVFVDGFKCVRLRRVPRRFARGPFFLRVRALFKRPHPPHRTRPTFPSAALA
jgi:hypothetical protein